MVDSVVFFFFNDTATTEIYTLSLHDALPISVIAKAGDLAALLTNLEDRDVLFIDEIHRLSPAVEIGRAHV